jgi:hypothetical protein
MKLEMTKSKSTKTDRFPFSSNHILFIMLEGPIKWIADKSRKGTLHVTMGTITILPGFPYY